MFFLTYKIYVLNFRTYVLNYRADASKCVRLQKF